MFKNVKFQYGSFVIKLLLTCIPIMCDGVHRSAAPYTMASGLAWADMGPSNVPPCPDEAAIDPCFCYIVNDDPSALVMDCSGVQTEEQLADAFLADFPVREYQHFYMEYNQNLTRLSNVFQGTTFRIVYLNHVAVEVITDDCFIDSADTLLSLVIDGSMLNSTGFPFDTIKNYSKLNLFEIANSRLNSVPDLVSASITDVWLQDNEIFGVLPASALRNTPNLTEFHIYYNGITEIEPGAFNSLQHLRTVSMFDNLVSVLRAGTFVIANDVNIGITTNSIVAVEPRAFARVNDDARISISLSSNFMTEIVEFVWTDVLLYNNTYLSLSSEWMETTRCSVAVTSPGYSTTQSSWTSWTRQRPARMDACSMTWTPPNTPTADGPPVMDSVAHVARLLHTSLV